MNSLLTKIALASFAVLAFSMTIVLSENVSQSSSKDNELCLSCHEDPQLSYEKDGKTVSLYVDEKLYNKSVHAGAECGDCHLNYDPDEIPHSKTSGKVKCRTCHEDLRGIEKSVHAKVECYDCHTKHDVKPATEMAKDQTKNCLNCHQSSNIRMFSSSVHAKNNVGCDGCHKGGHQTFKIPKNQVTNVCGKCHNETRMAFTNSIHHEVFKGGNINAPVCTDCHGAHKTLTSKLSIESEKCLTCHLNEKLFPGDEKGSAKFVAQYKTSIHGSIQKGQTEAAGCVDCHGDHMINNPNDPEASTKRARLVETCGKCHSDVVESFKKSKHGQELAKGNENAPTCSDCHGEHGIKSTLLSDDFSKLNIADKCLSCHKEGKIAHKNYKGEEELVTDYKNSVHYKGLERGNVNSATCSDCHGAHEMAPFDDPDSRINKKKIAQTCGESNCHEAEKSAFTGSIHDAAIKEGNADAPSCNTCHGNHVILRTQNPENRLSSREGIVQTCSDCHDSKLITEKYGIRTKQVETFKESIHGIYIGFGSEKAANCASCHGNHNIRKEDDPRSSVNVNNIAQTCGQKDCHPNADVNFVRGKIHLDPKSKESGLIYYISTFFMYFTFLVLLSLFLYIILDLISKIRERSRKEKA